MSSKMTNYEGPFRTHSSFQCVADFSYSSHSGIKEFSEWPTIPQLYVKGEFVGGCDILLQSE